MGPDGDRRWQGPTASLLYRPLHAEPGSCDRKLLSTVDGFVLCLDGRIDNWTDLKEQNYGHDVESVVLNVYRSKGTAGLSLLVGDFALAIWDPTQQVLLVACDPLGRRPLYTLQRGEYFSWASQARPLLDAWGMMREVDSEYIADYLINNPSSHSPYLAVEQVHGGDAVVVTPGRIAREKYWSLQPNQTIEYPDDAQYEEHFREIFVEAVRCRLPENTPVFCELSGGVDSSSIVCAADDVCQQREGSRARIRTVSFVFNRSRSADEREYIALVEEQRRLRGLHVSEDDCPLLGVLPSSVQPDWPTNTLIFFQRYHRTAAEMKASGARVLLNGIGGDQLFWSEPPVVLCLADLLIERKVRRYLSELCDCARRSGWPLLKAFLHSVVPLLSTTRIIGEDDDIELGDWFTSDFIRKTALRDRRRLGRPQTGARLASSATQCAFIRRTMRTFALEPCSAEYYVDLRYPYLDRRLVEFALAIPLEQKVRNGQTRSIVRRALRGVLPEPIRVRTSKAGPDEAFHRAVIRNRHRLIRECTQLRTAEYGFVEPKRFENALVELCHGISTNPVQVMFTLSLELWLRTLEPRSEGAASQPHAALGKSSSEALCGVGGLSA